MNNNDTIIVDISFCYEDDGSKETCCSGLLQLCRDNDLDSIDKENQVMKVVSFQS